MSRKELCRLNSEYINITLKRNSFFINDYCSYNFEYALYYSMLCQSSCPCAFCWWQPLGRGGAVNSVSQRVIFRGTDGTAAAAAQWRKVKRSHHSACCSPLLLCQAESPLTRPCLPFFHTEDSENLVGDKHRCTQHTHARAI